MELRKIQVTGGSTHVVSLPKKWIDRNGLGRSDTVAIHEEPDGSLLLIPRSDARSPTRAITIDIPDEASTAEVVRRLVGAYIAGADEILVRTRSRMSPKVRQLIRDLTRDLVGVEVLEETANTIVLQDLVGVAEMDLRKTLTRMQRLARLMFDDAIEALAQRDSEQADHVTNRDDEVDRLLWMVSKQMHALLEQPRLAAKLDVQPAGALNYYLVARSLERMADHAAKISDNVRLLQGQTVPPEALASLAAQADVVRKVWDESFSALKKGDFASATRTADMGEAAADWRADFPHLLNKLPAETVTAGSLLSRWGKSARQSAAASPMSAVRVALAKSPFLRAEKDSS
ncbi:MAG TPA: phosphate uptake regulator PhoU, partial [Candidatus Thermoplasmatota archaeon]|nr:phosphate uptake regulator PhoU [Candidatus Thermoplasmatota archaeon]